ncbi:ent-kaurene oxidase [Pseudomassariella vexata]|uniref:Ent-kaurene oxidase n=1 Tax=Pseudomassariella vexata TaxID=1141098 RepID=A0A1Y2EFW9_9PEZI|nr:ent-kaurene oxidase [Pseudomassariella vexata]ORY70473.1 ent-kaurene oxidase [Pseudomassariella vexata]
MEVLRMIVYENLSSCIFVSLLFAGMLTWPHLVDEIKLRRYPLVGKERSRAERVKTYILSAYSAYEEGRREYEDKFHRMTTIDGDHVIVPNKYLDELRQRPDSEIDSQHPFNRIFENQYTGVFPTRSNTELVNQVVKAELTRSLARINPRLSTEVERTVREELPPCDDWTGVNVSNALMQIVAIVSGHIFLGPELCRSPDYLRSAVDYTVYIATAANLLKSWPSWMRGIIFLIRPEFRRLRQLRRDMKLFLKPLIEERRTKIRNGEQLSDDMLSWMLVKTEAKGMRDLTHLTNMQLLLTMAAIHTTTFTAARILYDLAAHPETVKDLRHEIRTVLDQNDGVMTTKALFDLKLMDSVMRESQRLNPAFSDGFRRYTFKRIMLKDGTCIPANCFIEAANGPVLRDAAFYPDPDKFLPTRFLSLRTNPTTPDPIGYKNREQYQFVSVTKENMSFGFGRHACPGRFFAANEIKLILARMLLEYDVRMPDGVEGPYENFHFGAVNGVDGTKEIMMRTVKR